MECSLVKICISRGHARELEIDAGHYDAVKMPRFVASLSQLPQLSEDIIFRGALRLQSALEDMHAASILHADMKSDNVLLNTADVWRLADFGACVEVGQPIQSCTEVCTPTACCFALQFSCVGHVYPLSISSCCYEMYPTSSLVSSVSLVCRPGILVP